MLTAFKIINLGVGKKANQPHYRPGVAQRDPRLRDNGPGWWYGCQPYATADFTPGKLLVLNYVTD